MNEPEQKLYMATIKVIVSASDFGAATQLIGHFLNGKAGVIDWGYAPQPGHSYRIPLVTRRAFPSEVVLPESYQWLKAEVRRLGEQRYRTQATEKELAELERAYEEAFDQIGNTRVFHSN